MSFNNLNNKAAAKQSLSDKWILPEGFTQLWLISAGLKGSIPANWRLPDSLETLALSKNRWAGLSCEGMGQWD